MTEKSGSRDSKTSLIAATPEKRKRGRPPGAKNKPKIYQEQPVLVQEKKRRGRPPGAKNKLKPVVSHTAETVVKKGRGRPKGSKNKPKGEDREKIVEKVKKAKVAKDNSIDKARPAKAEPGPESLDNHPLLAAVRWIEKNMHQTEVQYYRGRANKLGVSLHVAMASDMLGFFNVQDPEINKQIKKNNFIAITTNAIH
jgi:hypothetical protein